VSDATLDHASREDAPRIVHREDVPARSWPGIVTWRTLLGDGPGSERITLGVATIAPGAAVDGARHRHTEPEAYYVTAGEGVVHLGGEEHPVRTGSCVFVPGDLSHYVENRGPVPLELIFVFAVDRYDDVVYVFDDEHRDRTGATPGPPPRAGEPDATRRHRS
jgi:mannose-6-phosphate isomerase-like protein (cupin superfamily)